MKKEQEERISKELGVQAIEINSADFSAQNRNRLYWTNIPIQRWKDKGIVLQDILENGVASELMTNKNGKSHCITARYNGAVWWNSIQRRQRTMVQVGEVDNIKGFDSIKRIYSPNGKAPTLTTMQGGHREPKVAIGRIVNRRLDENGVRKDDQLELPYTKQIEISNSDKSNCLTTFTKDNVLVEGMEWRKLTCRECERLQTVPDLYTQYGEFDHKYGYLGEVKPISNSQRYKMLGNGWTTAVIEHIFKGVKA
jgi:site-specific DNA-cytosine methylase